MEVLTLSIVVLKVGRVAIITRGRYAGKKVNTPSDMIALDEDLVWEACEQPVF